MSVNNISGDEDSSCEESEIEKSQFGLLPYQFEPAEVAVLSAESSHIFTGDAETTRLAKIVD